MYEHRRRACQCSARSRAQIRCPMMSPLADKPLTQLISVFIVSKAFWAGASSNDWRVSWADMAPHVIPSAFFFFCPTPGQSEDQERGGQRHGWQREAASREDHDFRESRRDSPCSSRTEFVALPPPPLGSLRLHPPFPKKTFERSATHCVQTSKP